MDGDYRYTRIPSTCGVMIQKEYLIGGDTLRQLLQYYSRIPLSMGLRKPALEPQADPKQNNSKHELACLLTCS